MAMLNSESSREKRFRKLNAVLNKEHPWLAMGVVFGVPLVWICVLLTMGVDPNTNMLWLLPAAAGFAVVLIWVILRACLEAHFKRLNESSEDRARRVRVRIAVLKQSPILLAFVLNGLFFGAVAFFVVAGVVMMLGAVDLEPFATKFATVWGTGTYRMVSAARGGLFWILVFGVFFALPGVLILLGFWKVHERIQRSVSNRSPSIEVASTLAGLGASFGFFALFAGFFLTGGWMLD